MLPTFITKDYLAMIISKVDQITSFPGVLPRQLISLIGILKYPFASSYSLGTKPPRWRARDTME